MATKIVTLPEIGAVSLYKRRGNRSLRLSISAGGQVRVSLPSWLPYKAAEQFALSKKTWILSHQPLVKKPSLTHGQAVGKAHRLRLEPHESNRRITTRLAPNEIIVRYPLQRLPHEPVVQTAARQASIRALRKESEALLPQRLHQLSLTYDLPFNSVCIKHLKSRWGSCSSQGDITLNLFLMQLPWHLIDYVLLHELTHTKVMRHGAPFWQAMERHAPNAKQLRKEIREHQPTLLVE